MPSETPQTNVDMRPKNRFPLWLVCLGSGLVAGAMSTLGGELSYEKIHADPDYPASFESMSGSERAVARAQVRFKTKVVVETRQAAAALGMLGLALGIALGLTGALAAVLAITIPASALVVWLTRAYDLTVHYRLAQSIANALVAAALGTMIGAAVLLVRTQSKRDRWLRPIAISTGAFLLAFVAKLSPLQVIAVAAAVGFFWPES